MKRLAAIFWPYALPVVILLLAAAERSGSPPAGVFVSGGAQAGVSGENVASHQEAEAAVSEETAHPSFAPGAATHESAHPCPHSGDAETHRMEGLPSGLYYLSCAAILLLSFLLFDLRSRATTRSSDPPPRFNLLRFRFLRALATSRRARFGGQLATVTAFVLIIAAGLFGNQNPALNIAPCLTWTVWWAGIVILILYFGKAWCYVCPWDALSTWVERLALWRKREQGLGLGLPWPRALRNIWLATILFLGFTWIEIGFGVSLRPRLTAYLGLLILILTFLSLALFERKSFCRYGCLVGRISGLYALFAGIELRPADRHTCKTCRGKDCWHGNARGYGCPTFEFPGSLTSNTYCTLCSECLKTCPADNLRLNLRPWGADLAGIRRPRADEAYLAIAMLSLASFHGLTMTPSWQEWTERLASALGANRLGAFSLGMAAALLLPLLFYAATVELGRRLAADPSVRYEQAFLRFAYPLLPIALFYHLAHNLEHLLVEGPKVTKLASDPFGWGWNLFGTAHTLPAPLLSLSSLWHLQVLMIIVGHVYGLWAASESARKLFADPKRARLSQVPMLCGMVGFSLYSLWLLKQPMLMRMSAM